jgi:hypothetical protein
MFVALAAVEVAVSRPNQRVINSYQTWLDCLKNNGYL